jgi:hypothetical protein
MLQQSLVQRMSFRVRDAVHQTVPSAPSPSSSVFVLYRSSVRIASRASAVGVSRSTRHSSSDQ